MFDIFHGDVPIGRSELEHRDPPMGAASGRFEPTGAFTLLRDAMKPTQPDAAGVTLSQRTLDVCVRTADGTTLVCSAAYVVEYGEADDPFELEVYCLGISQPPYAKLFPHEVKAYYGDGPKE